MKREFSIGEIVTSEMIQEETGITEYEGETVIQSDAVTDIIGSTGLYDTFARKTTRQPFTYAGECAAGSSVNRQAGIAEMIYICSPFRTADAELQQIYIGVAKSACANAAEEGLLPIAPHLYFPTFLTEEDPEQRDFGLSAGIRALKACDRMRVYVIDGRISDGMQAEIWHAVYRYRMEPEYIEMTMEEAKNFARIHTKEG